MLGCGTIAPTCGTLRRRADRVLGGEGIAVQKDQSAPFDTSVAHIARVYNYWLGGKDNFAADRELAQKFMAVEPEVIVGVRGNRAFLGRAVHCLAADEGIRQFLDIGTGIPTA